MLRRLERIIAGAAVAVGLCFPVSVAHAAGPYNNTTPATFTNGANPCTGTPLNVSIPVGDAFTVSDLDLGLMVTHGWRLDSQVTLTSPLGTSVQLIDSVDGNSSSQLVNYNVRLDDDDATRPIVNTGAHGNDPASPTYATRVRPNSPLSAFDGENAFGTWTLSFCDVFGPDDGTFTSAELIFAGQVATTPPELSCGATALRHDWNNLNWPAGSLSQQYTTSGEDFRITMSGTTGAFIPIPATTTNTPVTNSLITGGQGVTESSLLMVVDHVNRTNTITATIDIGDLGGGPNIGVGELQFTLFDVDFGAAQFQDRVVIAGSRGGVAVTPNIADSGANTATGNTVLGDSAAASATADGNVVVTFLQPVDQVTVTYGNGASAPTNPGQQAITIYDLVTCPVTTAVLAGSKSISTVGGGYALPGNDVIYKISIQNTGNGATDDDSIVLIDAMPAQIDFFRGAALFEAVTFSEPNGPTGLDFDYARDVGYSNAATKPANFAACTYDPATGYDPTVTFVCINPKDTLAGGTDFDVEFRARIK